MTAYDLDPTWTFATSKLLADGSSTLHQDKMSGRILRQWLCCCELRFPAQKHSLLVERSYQGRLCLALSSSLLTARFPTSVMKVKGQFLVFTSSIVFIAIRRPIQVANSTRKSAVFEFKEMGSSTQQLSRWITIILGVGCHPVPEMKTWSGEGPAFLYC